MNIATEVTEPNDAVSKSLNSLAMQEEKEELWRLSIQQ